MELIGWSRCFRFYVGVLGRAIFFPLIEGCIRYCIFLVEVYKVLLVPPKHGLLYIHKKKHGLLYQILFNMNLKSMLIAGWLGRN